MYSAVLTLHATVPEPCVCSPITSSSFPVFQLSVQLHLFQASCLSAQANEFALISRFLFSVGRGSCYLRELACLINLLLSLSFSHFFLPVLPESGTRMAHLSPFSHRRAGIRDGGNQGCCWEAFGAKITLAIYYLLICLLLAVWVLEISHPAPGEVVDRQQGKVCPN